MARPGRRRVVAVDGKTVRGAVDTNGHQPHLLAAFDTTSQAVLAQREVDTKTNETNETNESVWPCGPRGSDEMLAVVRRARSSL